MNEPDAERSVDSIPRGEESDDSKWQILADLGDKERGSAPTTAEAEPGHHEKVNISAEEKWHGHECERIAAEVERIYDDLKRAKSTHQTIPPESISELGRMGQGEEKHAEGQCRQEEILNTDPAERAAITEEMSAARDYFESHERERLWGQRAQEAVERDLNSRLPSVEYLEEQIVKETPGIAKRDISYDGEKIPVYELCGMPFSLLTTTIDYKTTFTGGTFTGTETARLVMENPAVWLESREEAEKTGEFGTERLNSRASTLNLSYRNSESNLRTYATGDLIYGYASVRPDSIIYASPFDVSSRTSEGDSEPKIHDINDVKSLETVRTQWYNEITTRRYDENGKPRKPDYIVVHNGKITEVAKKHAKFFGIPIIDVKEEIYDQIAKRQIESILGTITTESSWEEVHSAFQQLYGTYYFKEDGAGLTVAMEGLSIRRSSHEISRKETNSFSQELKRCIDIEFDKRIDHIIGLLNLAANSLEETGKIPEEIIGELPDLRVNDVEGGRMITKNGIEKFPPNQRFRHTEISLFWPEGEYYSGRTVLRREKSPQNQSNSPHRGRYYDMLAPVAMRYLQALWRSQGKPDPTTLANT